MRLLGARLPGVKVVDWSAFARVSVTSSCPIMRGIGFPRLATPAERMFAKRSVFARRSASDEGNFFLRARLRPSAPPLLGQNRSEKFLSVDVVVAL